MAPSHFYSIPPSILVQSYSYLHSDSFSHFSLWFMNLD